METLLSNYEQVVIVAILLFLSIYSYLQMLHYKHKSEELAKEQVDILVDQIDILTSLREEKTRHIHALKLLIDVNIRLKEATSFIYEVQPILKKKENVELIRKSESIISNFVDFDMSLTPQEQSCEN